jgi:hypothetical protein
MAIRGILDLLRLNPFPERDPRREDFLQMAQTIGEQQARLAALFLEKLRTVPDEDLLGLHSEACAAIFDLWARAWSPLAAYQSSEAHITLLDSLAEWVIDQWVNYPKRWIPASLVVDVRARVTERKFHWTAEALKLARETPVRVAGIASSQPRAAEASTRRASVDAYLAEASARTGKPVTRTDFWKAAGYRSRTEFERWQRADPRTTDAARRAFERILRDRPHWR